MLPKLDVIVPVRDGEKYLESAVASLAADAEFINKLIIVNDGSSDGTASILSSLAWKGKLQVIHQPPIGISAALNHALHAAETPLVARMDADDISIPGRFKAQIEYLEGAPAVAAVGSQVLIIDSAGTATGERSNYPLDSNAIRTQLYKKGSCAISHPTVVMRRDAVLACGGYRAAFQHAEDYDLWLRLSERHRIVNLPEAFLYYRLHQSQVASQFRARQSFSRDLALYAARERERSGEDPCDGLREVPNFEELMRSADRHGTTIRELATAYDAIDAIQEKRRTSLTIAAADAIPALARKRYLGESRRRRYALIRKAAWTGLTCLNFQTAFEAYLAFLECRISDSKMFQSMTRNLGATG
ncbi:glycosyltransferase [Hyphomicrobium sp. 99]|uniref:glycosyltransferase n=1 Tax=Hyphomicrobium sp. 99 TaxID=1163419 RepID=UPI0006977601|nr:glycosyltransferase [Hyphomicrobium sp. 99]